MTTDGRAAGDADPFDLERFVTAQAAVFDAALAELRAGSKRSHWMWFVFPQLAGLGNSPTAWFYGIRSCAEARAYLAHPTLGARLRDCAQVLLELQGRSAVEIFGYPDVLKLRSALTLFDAVADGDSCFSAVLDKYYGGERDVRTLQLLEHDSPDGTADPRGWGR